jgi:hypothetical protein
MATANQKISLLGFDDLWWDVTVSRNVIIQNGNDQMCFTPRTSTWATCSGIQFEISTGSGVCTNNIIVGNAGSGILQFDSNNMTVLNNLIATNMASTNGNDTSLNGGLGDNIALEFQACSGRQYNENRYENGTMPSVLWPSYGCGLPPTTDAATFKNWLVAGNILQGGQITGGWLVGDNRTGCKHMCNNTAVGNAVNGLSRTGGGRLIEERDNTQTTINASINLNALELRLVVGEIVQGHSPVIAANVLDFYGRPRIIGRVTAGPFQSLVQGKVNILKLWPIFDEGGYVPWEWLGNDGGRKSSLKADDSIVGPQNQPLSALVKMCGAPTQASKLTLKSSKTIHLTAPLTSTDTSTSTRVPWQHHPLKSDDHQLNRASISCNLHGHWSSLPKKLVNGTVEHIQFFQHPGNTSFTLRTTDWDRIPKLGPIVSHGQVVSGSSFVGILMPVGPPWIESCWTVSADCAHLCIGAHSSCGPHNNNWCKFPNACPFPAPASWPPWPPATEAPPSPPFAPPVPPAPPAPPEQRLTCGGGYGWGANGPACPDPEWEPTWALNRSTMISNIEDLDPEVGASWGIVTYPWNIDNAHWQNHFPHPGEEAMDEQCSKVKALGTGTKCMVYRQNELSLQWQKTCRDAQTADNAGMYLQFKTKELCQEAAPCDVAAFHQNSNGKPLIPCNKSAALTAPNCAYCCNFSSVGNGVYNEPIGGIWPSGFKPAAGNNALGDGQLFFDFRNEKTVGFWATKVAFGAVNDHVDGETAKQPFHCISLVISRPFPCLKDVHWLQGYLWTTRQAMDKNIHRSNRLCSSPSTKSRRCKPALNKRTPAH